ncbi:MAG TPA: hypothetical protein VNA16_06305, partial [Abditibacteriaceae bacterium]|nr:hypothetical protein [Abditibacteriaceae bacterium]
EPERTAAQKRLQVLEAQWEEKLRRQETERLAELTRLRTAIPQRLRGEGVTHIALELDAVRRRYDAARQAVAEAQRTRIAQDFTMEENSLGIVLPSASLGPQQLEPQKLRTRASIAGGGRAGQHKNIRSGGSDGIIETVRADLASTGRFGLRPDLDLFADKSKPASSRAARIRALRALALSDARRWAQSAARRAGWEWIANSHTGSGRVSTSSGVAAPDRTQEALRLLNLS